MTQRDRLIELLKKQVGYTLPIFTAPQTIEIMVDALLANGVFVPPVKVGQTVYVLRSKTSNGKNLYLREERIDSYRMFADGKFMCFDSGRVSVSEHLWETTVFLTREEAEKALAER